MYDSCMYRKEMFAKQCCCTYEAAHSCNELKKYPKSSAYFINEQVSQANFKWHLPEGKKVKSE